MFAGRKESFRASVDVESERPSRRKVIIPLPTHLGSVRSEAPCPSLKIWPCQPTQNFQWLTFYACRETLSRKKMRFRRISRWSSKPGHVSSKVNCSAPV